MNKKYKYILIEGMDATGKTEVSKELALMLNAYRVYQPGSNVVLREFIKSDARRPAEEQTLLFMADRVAVHREIKHYLRTADVVGDRDFPSNLVYQGIIDKRLKMVVELHNLFSANLVHPDHIIVLDCDLQTAIRRRKARDLMDARWMQSFGSVRKAYKTVAEKLDATLIDTSKLTVPEVLDQIVKIIG